MEDLTDFRPYAQLKVFNEPEENHEFRLAAAPVETVQVPFRKVGTLVDEPHGILARVFKDEMDESFHLHFLGGKDNGPPLKYSILTSPSSFKYIPLDGDARAVIRQQDNLDPLSIPLQLSVPLAHFQVAISDLFSSEGPMQSDLGNYTLSRDNDLVTGSLHLVFEASSVEPITIPTKLLLFSPDSPHRRLIPLRGGGCTVLHDLLLEWGTEQVHLCLYE